MFGMPPMGWFALSAQGKPVPFFGMQLPQLVGERQFVADWAKKVHQTCGTVGCCLNGLHAAAALFHRCIVRHGALRRMLLRRG